MYDLNDAEPQRGPVGELIPCGTFAKLTLAIRPGGVNGSTPMDAGLLKAASSSDAKMLDCEFTVVAGPYARRKLWQMFTVAGGKLDDKGQSKGWGITKSAIRAMIDSALGLDPKDMSEGAKQKRTMQGLRELDGITFAARIMIEPATDPRYQDQNKIANIVVPGDPQYAAVMRGEAVEPDPINAKPKKPRTDTAAASAPAWANGGQPQGQGFGSGAAPAPQQASPGPAWLNG